MKFAFRLLFEPILYTIKDRHRLSHNTYEIEVFPLCHAVGNCSHELADEEISNLATEDLMSYVYRMISEQYCPRRGRMDKAGNVRAEPRLTPVNLPLALDGSEFDPVYELWGIAEVSSSEVWTDYGMEYDTECHITEAHVAILNEEDSRLVRNEETEEESLDAGQPAL